jgi:hypothetical protein
VVSLHLHSELPKWCFESATGLLQSRYTKKKPDLLDAAERLLLALNDVPPWSNKKCDALFIASESLKCLLIDKKAPKHWLRLTTYTIKQCQLSGYLSLEYQKLARDQ